MYSLTNKYQVNTYVIIFKETANTSEVMCSSPITIPSLLCIGNYYLDFGSIHFFFLHNFDTWIDAHYFNFLFWSNFRFLE